MLKDWDVAAADVVLSEAGGCFLQADGSKYSYDGSYYKQGVIATTTRALAQQAVDYME